MLPGPVLCREPVLAAVDGAVLPPEELSVLSHRTDLNAYAKGEMPFCFSSARWAEQLILSICPAEGHFSYVESQTGYPDIILLTEDLTNHAHTEHHLLPDAGRRDSPPALFRWTGG